jgi:recombination protein RecA
MSLEQIASLKKKYPNAYFESAPPLQLVRTGLLGLDYILGGGLPLGRIIEVAALPICGKSTLAMFIAKNLADKYGITSAYLDLETTVTAERCATMGIDMSKFHYAVPDSGKQALEMAMEFMLHGIQFVVIDSVSHLGGTGVQEVEDTELKTNFAGTARLLSESQHKLTNTCYRTKSILFFINQLRTVISSWGGGGLTSSGGCALSYMVSVQIRINKLTSNDIADNLKLVEYQVKKNKIGQEGLKCKGYITEEGLCPYMSAVELFRAMNLVVTKGSWYYFDEELAKYLNVEPKIGQGQNKVLDFLKNNPLILDNTLAYLKDNDEQKRF